MTTFSEFKKARKSLAPPQGMVSKLEDGVMQDVDRLPRKHRRRKIMLAAGSALLATVLLFVLTPHQTQKTANRVNTDFTESVVIMEDHVFIWLEPVPEKPGARHD
jgi:hypothetical protein